MKANKPFSIGYKDSHNDFSKVWDEKGSTRKFETVDQCKEYIESCKFKTIYKIMRGWEVVEVIDKR